MVQFIGRHVRVLSSEFALDAGNPTPDLYVNLPADAAELEVTVKDEDGKIVRTMKVGARDGGLQEIEWDGMRDDGTPAPAGTYSFTVDAKDADGESIQGELSTIQEVRGVTYDAGYPVLVLESGANVSLGEVLDISSEDGLIADLADE